MITITDRDREMLGNLSQEDGTMSVLTFSAHITTLLDYFNQDCRNLDGGVKFRTVDQWNEMFEQFILNRK